jgi:hypothetical protein
MSWAAHPCPTVEENARACEQMALSSYSLRGRSLALPLGHETLTLQPRVPDLRRQHVIVLNDQQRILAGLRRGGAPEKAFANNTKAILIS